MERQNMLELCRLCLKKSDCTFSLFLKDIFEKLASLAPVEIKEDDELPRFCCETCLSNIHICYNFRQEILQSDKILRDMLCKTKTDPEVLELVKESPELFEVLRLEEDNLINPKIESFETEALCDEVDYSYLKNEPVDDSDMNVGTDDLSAGTVKISAKDETNITFDDTSTGSVDEAKPDDFVNQVKAQLSTLTCEKCNKKFPTRRRFSRHMQGHKVEMCTICYIVIRRDNLKKHIEMHGSPHEICDICGKVAKNRESLRGHIYYTHRKIDKHIKCEHCNKEFKHNNHYLAHVRNVHLVIRNQQCHVCGKKFSNGYALKKHINMTHNGSRPHVCQYCKKGFSSPYALKTHVRQHTHETPYGCEYCDQAFRQKVSLLSHLKSKHGFVSSKKE